MDELQSKNDHEDADIICNDCNGNIIQVQVPNNNKLFTKTIYVKWLYACQLCQKKSKVFTSRIQNNIQ